MDSLPMRVLVATDGSEPARLGVDLVADAVWPVGTEVMVTEAVETGPGLFGGPWPTLALIQADHIETAVRAEAERRVQEARDRLTRAGLSAETVVVSGRPATTIVERARAMRADLIIVGSRGHGTIETMLLGSVSAEVVDESPVPVLVVRRPRTDRVVLAWDGSSCAKRAADLLRAWPMFAAASVRVVSVADFEIPWWNVPVDGSLELQPIYADAAAASRAQRDDLARQMVAGLRTGGLAAEAEPREGDAATEILAAATAWKADVIVMGTHGRTGLSRLVLGSVARNVLEHATCSVLVVRNGDSPDPTGHE